MYKTGIVPAILAAALLGCAPKEQAPPPQEATEEAVVASEQPAAPAETPVPAEAPAAPAEAPAAPIETPAPAPAAEADKLPEAVIPVPAVPPVIDGALDDACWQQAPLLPMGFLWGGLEKPKQKTEVRVLADREAFYVAFTCSESHMQQISAEKTERDSEVWQDDDVEVFLLPGRTPSANYYQVLVNAGGVVADLFPAGDLAWDAKGLKVAVKRLEDRWLVEIALPWQDLAGDKPLPAEWRANFTRTRHSKGATYYEDQAWSATLGEDSHVPDRFGYITISALKAE